MRIFTLIFLLSPSIYSQDLTFQHIKKWNNYDYFAKSIFDNYWNVSESSRFFIKATHSELGEIFYYNTINIINTKLIRMKSGYFLLLFYK